MSYASSEGFRIIAFTGPKTCGKDTMAQGLLKLNTTSSTSSTRYPFFGRTPFASGVKQICHDVFGWDWEDMDKADFKDNPSLEWPFIEPRWPMMDIANFMREKYGEDVWVKALGRRIYHLEQTPTTAYGAYLVTDLRFPNEIEWLQRQNSLIIYVQRDEAEERLAKAKAVGDAKALNPSEAHYAYLKERADVILDNNGTIYQGIAALQTAVRQRFDYWGYWGVKSRDEVE